MRRVNKNILLSLPLAAAAVLALSACGSSTPAAAPSSAAAPATSPAASAPPTASPSPSPSTTAKALPPAQADAKAAAVLLAADASLRTDFEKGAALTGGPKVDWWSADGGYPDHVALVSMAAFKNADQFFTADDEPSSITDWNDAWSNVTGDVTSWYQSDHGQGEDPALKTKVESDFTAIDALANKVAAGK